MTKGDWSEDTKAIGLSKRKTLIHMQRRGQIWVFCPILIDPVITYQD
jgi:hypothetical protein